MTVMRRSTTRRGLIPSLRVRSRAGFTLAEVMVAIVVFALGLLGAAYEESGQMARAGQAYEDAAAAGGFPTGQAQHLADAGRAWTLAGDTARALAVYQRVLRDYAGTAVVTEATVAT